MRRTVISGILGMAMLLGLASQASAQSVDAGGGLQRQGGLSAFALKFGADSPVMTSGDFQTSVIGEFGLQFFDGITQKTLFGGVRFASTKDAKARPFGQVQVGGFFCCEDKALGLMFGGGVDVPMTSFTLRIQVDIPVALYEGVTESGFRFNVGIAFPLKK